MRSDFFHISSLPYALSQLLLELAVTFTAAGVKFGGCGKSQ